MSRRHTCSRFPSVAVLVNLATTADEWGRYCQSNENHWSVMSCLD
jgi:hypothetical protein